MPLTAEDRAFLKSLYGSLADRPLEPDDPFYEPIYAHADGSDPVALMRNHIEFSDTESIQEFSGFSGTGKTTELFRLRRELEEQGYYVIYSDAFDYLNPSEPIEASDMLIALAGAFSDGLKQQDSLDVAGESFWTRMWNFLNSDVELKEFGTKLGELDLKFELKSGSTFRQKLQKSLAGRLRDVKKQTDSFFADGIRAVREKHNTDKKSSLFLIS